jgi:hypothetical protein
MPYGRFKSATVAGTGFRPGPHREVAVVNYGHRVGISDLK